MPQKVPWCWEDPLCLGDHRELLFFRKALYGNALPFQTARGQPCKVWSLEPQPPGYPAL